MTDPDSLLAALLAVPTSKDKPQRVARDSDFTSRIEVTSSGVSLTVNDKPGATNEGTARSFLEAEGLNPDEWEIASFAKSEWGDPDNLKESVKFSFKPKSASVGEEDSGVEELVEYLNSHTPRTMETVPTTDAFVVVIGDMQYGKYESPADRTLARAFRCIDEAAEQAFLLAPDHIHVAWMGDHVEGFVSQGGANVWRTNLTLMEQTRLVRATMTYAMKRLWPLTPRLTMAAVPGNHGEPQRFEGKGITRYDDSHDTEALVAVSEAASLSDHYQNVEFFVPENDEMTVLLEVGGAYFAHAHGHQWRPGKHFDWWRGQSFGKSSSMHMADVLLAGHLHHGHIEEDGTRLYVGCPALELESTWYRHSTGTEGNPGILTLTVREGAVGQINFIRGNEGGVGA